MFTIKSLAPFVAGAALAIAPLTAAASANPFAGTNPIYAYTWQAGQAHLAAESEMSAIVSRTVFLMNSPNYAALFADDSDPYMIALSGFGAIDQAAQAAIAQIGAGSNDLLATLESMNAPRMAISAVLNVRERAIVAVIMTATQHKAAIHQAYPANRGPRTPLTGPELWISNVTLFDQGSTSLSGLADEH